MRYLRKAIVLIMYILNKNLSTRLYVNIVLGELSNFSAAQQRVTLRSID